MIKNTTLTLLLALLAACPVGCAGARVDVRADGSRYPLSLSGSVRDSSGRLYEWTALRKLAKLQVTHTRLGFVYSAFTPGSADDYSAEVNAQVASVQGEAVVNLMITLTEGCAMLNMFPVLNMLPFWPGCVTVEMTGDIVRRRPPASSSPG